MLGECSHGRPTSAAASALPGLLLLMLLDCSLAVCCLISAAGCECFGNESLAPTAVSEVEGVSLFRPPAVCPRDDMGIGDKARNV